MNKVILFGTQPYDRDSFEQLRDAYGFDICYHRSHLNIHNVALAQGADAVCIFVNDNSCDWPSPFPDNITSLSEENIFEICFFIHINGLFHIDVFWNFNR